MNSGIIIGCYNIIRICSSRLHDEKYIENTFNLFQYPNYFIFIAKRKVHQIHVNRRMNDINNLNKTRLIKCLIDNDHNYN